MTNKKSTKRALLMSALALVVCLSMLIGSTYAWFTDSVTSSGNKIVSGKLEVDLLMGTAVDTYHSIADQNAAIFGANSLVAQNNAADTLWEPGKTQIVYLGVENKGNLALKYNILLDVIDGGLVGALEYAIIDGAKFGDITATDWATIKGDARAQTGDVAAGTIVAAPNGAIEAAVAGQKAVDYFALAVHMKEDAGNQYQDKNITIDVTVYATQLASEEDAFDNQYDAGLVPTGSGISRTFPDGSTAFYYDENSGFGGRVRLTSLPENLGNEYEVPAEVNDLGGALVGKTLDKLTIPAGVEYAYKSLQGATIDTVVIKEGATTIPNRMFYKTTIGTVEIPSTVTYIDENAFAMATTETLVIPASVTTVGEAAFQHMPNLKTVTFEGNTAIQGFAFRGCADLRTVYLKGDDVTFVPSTLSGKNSTWFCNGESNNPNTSNITFYVENETVAARVKTAMGAEAGNTPVFVNGTALVNVASVIELQNALDNATQDTLFNITADLNGDVSFTQVNGVSLTFDGNHHTMNGSINITARASTSDTATLTIKELNFKTTDSARDFISSSETNYYPNNLTISDCTFEGTGADSTVVAIRVKTANNLVVENCTANNVHSLMQNDRGGTTYTIRKCTVTNAGRGINLNSVKNATLEEVTIEASDEKYGVRIDAEYDTTATFKNCNISAFCPVVVRKASKNYNLVFEGNNTMTAANTDGLWCAIGTSEYETNGVLPTAATGSVTVALNGTGLTAAGIYGAAN